jgi:hypothetical protein
MFIQEVSFMKSYNLDEKSGLGGMFSNKPIDRFLNIDDLIEIKHFSMDTPIKSRVKSMNGKELHLVSDTTNTELTAFPKDPIALAAVFNTDGYIISAYINHIESLDPIEIIADVDRIIKKKQLRKAERFYVSYTASLKVLGILEEQFSVVKNISFSGVKINCKVDIQLEDIVTIKIKIDKERKFEFSGRIVRKNTVSDAIFEYGIEIAEITESNSKVLHRVIHALQYE